MKKLDTMWKKVAYGIFALLGIPVITFISILPLILVTDLFEKYAPLYQTIPSSLFSFTFATAATYAIFLLVSKVFPENIKWTYVKKIFLIYAVVTSVMAMLVIYNVIHFSAESLLLPWHIQAFTAIIDGIHGSQIINMNDSVLYIEAIFLLSSSLALIYYFLHRKFSKK